MFVAELIAVHGRFGVCPDSVVKVDIGIDRLEHSADDTLWKIACITCVEVDSLASENVCGKVVVAVFPCGLVPLDRAAILSFEQFKFDLFGRSVCVGVDVIVSKPLDFLVCQFNVLKLRHCAAQSVSLFLVKLRLIDSRRNSRGGLCGGSGGSFVACVSALVGGSVVA